MLLLGLHVVFRYKARRQWNDRSSATQYTRRRGLRRKCWDTQNILYLQPEKLHLKKKKNWWIKSEKKYYTSSWKLRCNNCLKALLIHCWYWNYFETSLQRGVCFCNIFPFLTYCVLDQRFNRTEKPERAFGDWIDEMCSSSISIKNVLTNQMVAMDTVISPWNFFGQKLENADVLTCIFLWVKKKPANTTLVVYCKRVVNFETNFKNIRNKW